MGKKAGDWNGSTLEIIDTVLGQAFEIIPVNLDVVCVSGLVCPVLIIVQRLGCRLGRISGWTTNLTSVLNQRLSDRILPCGHECREEILSRFGLALRA